MQETLASRLLPALMEQMRSGADLQRLVAAAALTNCPEVIPFSLLRRFSAVLGYPRRGISTR